MPLTPGDIHRIPYPFVRTTYTLLEEDGDYDKPCWRPGVVRNPQAYGIDALADGLGQQTLTVVSLHTPGKYPPRVFYTRQWTDPDGKTFGTGALRCCTAQKFQALIQGYRFPYNVEP